MQHHVLLLPSLPLAQGVWETPSGPPAEPLSSLSQKGRFPPSWQKIQLLLQNAEANLGFHWEKSKGSL